MPISEMIPGQEQPLFGPGVDVNAPHPLCASGKSLLSMRNYWGKKFTANRERMREVFRLDIQYYMKIFRHEMQGILPGRFMTKDRIDVNVVYPIIKTMVPQLYFKDPKVMMEALAAKFEYEAVGPDGLPLMGPDGAPAMEAVDGPRAAALLAGSINRNLLAAKTKKAAKSALLDALLCPYGVVKLGWDNEQGVYQMAEGEAPPNQDAAVQPGMAYSVRLKPWDVYFDDCNFYKPQWVMLRYAVNPWQLKTDKRLLNTEALKGNVNTAQERYLGAPPKRENLDSEPLTEYCELYHRPSAEYPKGLFMMFTDEVKEDFLFLDEFPYEKTKELPTPALYFNEDPEGGLPVPGIRYIADQQKAKSNLRNTEYEYIRRTLPIFVVDNSLLMDEQKAKADLQSGRIPRVLMVKQNANQAAAGISFNNLNADFRQFDAKIDDDISRTFGMIRGAGPAGVADTKLATNSELGAQTEGLRIGELADIMRDFMSDIVTYWGALFQEYSGEKMYAPIEGQPYPVEFSWRDIRGRFLYKIKPFSMNYEDPAIVRRQILDLLNLLASPQVAEGLKRQGKMVDIERQIKRIQETYDDRDVDQFVVPYVMTPEEQLQQAQMRQALLMGSPLNPVNAAPQKPGGGNKEGLPVNGVAVNQEMMRQPLEPNMAKSAASTIREATVTR